MERGWGAGWGRRVSARGNDMSRHATPCQATDRQAVSQGSVYYIDYMGRGNRMVGLGLSFCSFT